MRLKSSIPVARSTESARRWSGAARVSAGLADNPPAAANESFAPNEEVSCSFKPAFTSGSTPKFECERDDGRKIKVKYGRSNAEIYAEVAATRLLAALGFPADRMYVVGRVRCYGCPDDPFEGLQCLNEGQSVEHCFGALDYNRYTDFTDAVIERRLEGEKLETRKVRGWGWDELAQIDPAAGGAPRAHVDALRLLAVFLAHWDNKVKNQRLLCVGEDTKGDELPACHKPIAMVQDLGDTFGPFKFNLDGWRASPIWKDAATCTVSMRHLPYGGSSFSDVAISEEGRLFLANRLRKLSWQQVYDLFDGARVSQSPQDHADNRRASEWADVFMDKVHVIADRPPCPT